MYEAKTKRKKDLKLSFDVESFWHMPRCRRAKLCGRSTVSFLRLLHTDLQSGHLNLKPQQQLLRAPFPSHLHQHLLSDVFLVFTILTCVKQNFKVILICISLITKDNE